jgi:hypothetical protein
MRCTIGLLLLGTACGGVDQTAPQGPPLAIQVSGAGPGVAASTSVDSVPLTGSSGGPLASDGDQDVGGGGSPSVAGKTSGASGAAMDQAGGASGSDVGGDSGAGSAGAQSAPDPCSFPDGTPLIDCGGVCGSATAAYCSRCNGVGDIGANAYIVFGAASGAPGCPCDWTAYRMPVAPLTCARVRTEPGSSASLSDLLDSCSASTSAGCLVVSGIHDGAATERGIYLGKPDTAAWFHYERADLVNGVCPLSCP